jgi:hypothetical protein
MASQSRQQHDLFEKYIPEIATTTLENGGVAFNVDTCQFLEPTDMWSFPKYPGRTAILPPTVDLTQALVEFISRNEQFLREPGCWLGTWIHPQTGDYYLDIATGCRNLDEARKKALEASQRDGRKIVAIYNSKQKQTIYP